MFGKVKVSKYEDLAVEGKYCPYKSRPYERTLVC